MPDKYALMNPIALFLDKCKEDFTREDMLRVISEYQIQYITFHYVGLDGKIKELKLPISDRRQAEQILIDGERVDGSSLFKGLVDVSLSDLYVVPLYKTAFLNPFDPNSLDFICRYITRDGELAPFAPDTILKRAHTHFKDKTGMEFHALGELEFFLVSPSGSHLYPSLKQKGYHASGPYIKTGAIVNEMVRHIAQITGAVKYAHSEVGYVESVRSDLEELKGKEAEQLEIEFLPRPVEDAADYLVLARWLIRNIAFRHNSIATFAPKLEEGVAGNGMHVHMALMNDGKNLMTGADNELSPDARKLIGGLCKYATSLTAFGNTVSSAYLRLVPNQEAPTKVCWSDMNRSAMIRVPLGWSKVNGLADRINHVSGKPLPERIGRQTVELRSPDGSALTHLLLAGITMAALDGIENAASEKMIQSMYVQGNIFRDRELLDKLPSLPRSCVESARTLLANRELYEREGIFPPSIIDYMAEMLQSEKDEFINSYLADLPADDRLHETRKIMHKDLHKH